MPQDLIDGLDDGMVPSENISAEPMLTHIYVVIWRH